MHFFTVSQLTTRCRNLHHIDLRTCDDDDDEKKDDDKEMGQEAR